MTRSKTLMGASGLLLLVALATPGCATKKYVRQQVGGVDQRVSEVDKKQTDAVTNLEGKEQKDISRVEERAMGAENKANDAARAAQVADQKATQADQTARNATDLAQQAQTHLGEVQHAVQDIDKFKLVSSEDVLFGFNKANLTDEGKAKLDTLVQQSQNSPRYIVDVEGFTDRTGPRDYNLVLSRRRADTVVRYLIDHGVPLRRIHMIGLGETPTTEGVMAANKSAIAGQTPETTGAQQATGRKLTKKEMRRVVVNVYQPETTLSASSNAPMSQQPSQQNQPSQSPTPDQPSQPSPR